MADEQADAPANRDERVPVISLTESNTPSATPATPETPPSWSHSRSYTSPRTPGNRVEQLKNSPAASKIREKLEGLESRRSDGPSKVQERLLNLLLSQIIPSEDTSTPDNADKPSRKHVDRPGFSLPLMSNNFRRFNARVGVLFVLQYRLIRLFTWRRPSNTLSFLAIYSFICLDPYLLAVVPLALCIFYIMIPSFLARHPPPPNPTVHGLLDSPSLDGPPLAPAPKIKPAADLSKAFFRNMGDLQNSMEDFSRIHDLTVSTVLPPFNFSDEKTSSTLFVLLTFSCASLFLFAHLLPWRLLALVGGWAALLSQHPAIASALQNPENANAVAREEHQAYTLFQSFSTQDTILDPDPEKREVEIFEIQHRSPLPGAAGPAIGEWESHCFSPSPWDPMSPSRLAGERGPRGAKVFEEVQPPPGWRWADKKWRLDLLAAEWVGERMIVGVGVEMEGERWVYDVAGDSQAVDGRVSGGDEKARKRAESDKGPKKDETGEWRRRRWVRVVERVPSTFNGKDEKG